MSAEIVKFDFEFPNLLQLVQDQRDNIQMLAAASLQTQRGMIFDAEGAFNGRSRWQSLQFRTGMILSRSGGRGLRGSIAPKNDGKRPAHGASTILEVAGDLHTFTVSVGSTLIYAQIHNDGGVIQAKPGHYLMIPIPQGKWANDTSIKIQQRHAAIRISQLTDKLRATKSTRAQAAITNQIARVTKSLQKNNFKTAIFRKKVTIPARPYLDWTPDDARELNDTLVNYLSSLIGAA